MAKSLNDECVDVIFLILDKNQPTTQLTDGLWCAILVLLAYIFNNPCAQGRRRLIGGLPLVATMVGALGSSGAWVRESGFAASIFIDVHQVFCCEEHVSSSGKLWGALGHSGEIWGAGSGRNKHHVF